MRVAGEGAAAGRLARLRVKHAVVWQLGGLAWQVVPVILAYARSESMKVLDGLTAVAPGDTVSAAELGLPVAGGHGLLLVFWKST
jgi:hypothetical protein